MARMQGEFNVPGAPGSRYDNPYGNALAGTWARDPFPQGQQQGVDELFRRGINNTPTEQRLKNLRDVMKSNPGSLFAPQVMNGIGNMGGMLAQADPNATALGGAMRMQPGGAPPGMGEAPNVFSVRPRINYMDPEQGGLELGGAVNIPIGQRGRINVQGGYQPDTTQLNVNATVGQPQGAPGFGVDFFMNRKLRQPSSSPSMNDYGVMGRYGAEF